MDRIEIVLGDITKIPVDAIVNAANSSLMGGGGVDGAIHRAGGNSILDECRQIVLKQGGCRAGEAVITTAGKLPAKFVIHTVGPVWHGGNNNEEKILANCYINSLMLAAKNTVRKISFPNISTGVYGFPKAKAAPIAINTVMKFLKQNSTIEKVVFVCFGEDNYQLMNSALKAGS